MRKQNNNNQEEALRLLRESTKSNYQIAKETGISEATIGNYVNGKTKPTPANAKILIDYFASVTIRVERESKQMEFDFNKWINVAEKNANSMQELISIHAGVAKSNERLTESNAKLVDQLIESLARIEKKIDQKGVVGDANGVASKVGNG